MIYDDLRNFDKPEVLSPAGLDLLERGIIPQSPEAVLKLDVFRDFIGLPLFCNIGIHVLRGFRHPEEQAKIYKYHKYTFHFWCAFDISSPKLDAEDLFNEAVKFGWKGVYLDVDRNFVHVDYRGGKRWYARKQNGSYQLVVPPLS